MVDPKSHERETSDDDRMNDLEALMWHLDKDPHLTSVFANVTILDRVPDLERLRAKMRRAVRDIPRLRQRAQSGLGRLAPPVWVDDPSFDIAYHVKKVALTAPYEDRALYNLAARIHQQPLERTRPLWEFVIVEGLADGRGALIQKMHHSISDGVGALRLAERFVDLERDPDEPDGPGGDEPWVTEGSADNLVTRFGSAIGHATRRSVGAATSITRSSADLLVHPTRWDDAGREVIETAQSVARQLMTTGSSRSPLWTERSLWRRLETLQIPLEDARRAAKDAGVTINDIFVTATARAAGRVHRRAEAPVEDLRMAMPMSTRDDASAAGNAFALTRVLVPVSVTEADQHLQSVHQRLSEVRGERAFRLVEQLAGLANVLPTSVLTRVARAQTETVDFTTSNLRGAPVPLYIGGARMEANYPMGPLAGTAFNLTMLSHDGTMNLGLHVDTGAVADAGELRDSVAEAFDELLS